MQNALVNVNGQITNSNEAKISVFDRGFLYGDSLYEVARTYSGKFLFLDEHLDRLEKSAKLCRMALAQTIQDYHREIYRTFDAFRAQPGYSKAEAYCRIVVTRGAGKIGFGLKCVATPSQYVIIIQPVEPPTKEQYEKGLHLAVVPRLRNDRRALDPAMKSGNYLNNLLAYLEAEAEGYDDALLCNAAGHLTEGTTFNIFYVQRGIVSTPPLEIGILEGITRRHVIQVAKDSGIELREVLFSKERFYEADEAFITSSVKEIMPITRIDRHPIGNGKPGPVTLRLLADYRKEIQRVIS